MDEPEKTYPPSPARLSKTPSWVTLGFLLGVLFMWALPHEEKPAPPPPTGKSVSVQLERPRVTDIEAVFAEWGRYAVWENDLTEVALWDVDRKSYSIFYEILRNGDIYYFRSIPKLTRPILTHGVQAHSPLMYTEPEAMRREWLEQMRIEILTGMAKGGGK